MNINELIETLTNLRDEIENPDEAQVELALLNNFPPVGWALVGNIDHDPQTNKVIAWAKQA